MPVADFRTLRRQVEARGDEIDALTSICDLAKPARDALPASMKCSWDGSLAEFGANLQGVDRKLSHLSTLAAQSGIKSLLKLAYAGRLHDLCRDESVHARDVDRLTKELGLAKVCEGPDTDIDAIRLAVDFAAEVDSGALPPSVRCWLLQDFDANSPLLHAELSSYIESMSELQGTLLTMTKSAKLDVVEFWGCQTIYEVPFTAVAARLERALHCPDDLPMYVDWLRSWDECSAATLPALPRLALSNAVTTDGCPESMSTFFTAPWPLVALMLILI